MKTFGTIAALSAVLMMAGCSDTQQADSPPPAKPLGLMAAPVPTANAVEAVPVEDNIAGNASESANEEPAAQQTPSRRTIDTHTIGDRRQQ